MSAKKPPGEVAAEMARLAVETAAEVQGVRLDYSMESLAAVDEIVAACSADGLRFETHPATVWMFGCYVGEVLIRKGGGRWVAAQEVPGEEAAEWGFIQVRFDGDNEQRFCNPIGKVAKGMEDPAGGHELPWFGELALKSVDELEAIVDARTRVAPETPRRRGFWSRLLGRG